MAAGHIKVHVQAHRRPQRPQMANNKSLIEMILCDDSRDHSSYDSNPQQDFVLTLRLRSAINQRAAAMATGSTVTVRPLASPFPSGCLVLLSPKARMRRFFFRQSLEFSRTRLKRKKKKKTERLAALRIERSGLILNVIRGDPVLNVM